MACPYRRDVPSGVWSTDDYDKLRPYDHETWQQPIQGFRCHATPEHRCAGWAIVHSNRGHEHELLALRLEPADVPETSMDLFASGNEAADHGVARIDNPPPEACDLIGRLMRKYPRLED